MKIGIAGTGRMGTAIGMRLVGLGHDLTVWNRSEDKTIPLADIGARVAASPAALADACDIVITILTNAAAIDAVYGGGAGLLAVNGDSKLYIEMSTVRPATEQSLADKVRGAGAAFIDCPVGGSIKAAAAGTLLGLAGGSAPDVARARPLLEQLCRRVEHIGPIGAGATIKLAMNLTTQVYWQSFGEALSLCEPLGLSVERLMDLFAESSGAPKVFALRRAHMTTALNGDEVQPVNFDIDSVRKDVQTMLEEGEALGCRLPVASRALECFDEISRAGYGANDCAMLPALWVQRSRSGK